MSWFRFRKPPEQEPTVKEATEKRDALFVELDAAINDVDEARDVVDKVQSRLLNAYRMAEADRTKRPK